jgi:hypothetical protein
MYANQDSPWRLDADRTQYRPEATAITYGSSLNRRPYSQMQGKDARKLEKNYGSLGAKVLYLGNQYVTCATHCFVKMPEALEGNTGVLAYMKSAMYDLLRKIRKFRASAAACPVRQLAPNSPVGKTVYEGWGDTKVSFHSLSLSYTHVSNILDQGRLFIATTRPRRP